MNLRLIAAVATTAWGMATFFAMAGDEPRHTRNCGPNNQDFVKLYGETAERPDLWGCSGSFTKEIRQGFLALEDVTFYGSIAMEAYTKLARHVDAICSEAVIMVGIPFNSPPRGNLVTWEMDVMCPDKERAVTGR
jgi:hypothetical protein